MSGQPQGISRRALVKGLVAVGGSLVIASKLPTPAEAAGHAAYCGAPYGPLHRYLYATGPDPVWQDAVIWRESNWLPSAKNPRSTASGLAQFLDSTWAWGEERFGLWGSPFDPYVNIAMMSAFLREGEYYHWALTGWDFPRGVPFAEVHMHDFGREESGG